MAGRVGRVEDEVQEWSRGGVCRVGAGAKCRKCEGALRG